MKQHHLHIFILVCMLAAGAFTFWYAKNTALQLAAGIVTAIAYMLWGIIHHYLEHDLYPRIVIEYVLIGLIAIVLLVTLAV